MDLRSETGSYSDDMDRPESALEKGPEFIFRKLLRQASSLVEVRLKNVWVLLNISWNFFVSRGEVKECVGFIKY